MPPAGFDSVLPAKERKQTHVLDGAATGIGHYVYWKDQSVPAVQENNRCFFIRSKRNAEIQCGKKRLMFKIKSGGE